MFLRYRDNLESNFKFAAIAEIPRRMPGFRESTILVLAVLRPRSLESAQLGPRLCPEGVELGRRQQDVALVHPAGHQNALNQCLEVN